MESCCEINKDDKQIAIGDICNGLYQLRLPQKVCLLKSNSSNCIHIWHRKLGHRIIEAINNLNSNSMTSGLNLSLCDVKVKL